MTLQLNTELELWSDSPVVRAITSRYRRKSADQFTDAPAKLTPRQAVFYRNLIKIAEAAKSREIPIEFELSNGAHVHLDYGCIKIADHAGFIQPLINGPDGTVGSITLSWKFDPSVEQ
jgi:hypothetical protein